MPSSATVPLTLIVIARNEAGVIGRCLDSVPFAAEKLVVDCGSTDGTQEIAQAHGARVIHQEWLGFGAQRNFATTQATHDWILALDADETLSPELIEELKAKLPQVMQSNAAGGVLRRQTWYMGSPMRFYRPMVGERLGRLYHRARARWTDVRVHESLIYNGSTASFKHTFVHHHNPTLAHRHLKVLQYSELKARDWLDNDRPVWLWTTPFVFVGAFLKDYLLRLAFLDGGRGYVVAQVAAFYAAYKRLRYFEMKRNPASRELAAKFLGIRPDQ
jgi:glycosyltransferase involved in cell wall biosynthesis